MTKKLKVLTALVAITAMLWTVGKAVSAHGWGEHDADSLEQFRADGMGTLTGADTSQQKATIKGSFIGGNATLQFTLANGSVGFNGTGAFCAFKSGNATITDSHGKTITMTLAGVGCNGPAGSGTGNTEVTYVITGGTKFPVGVTPGGTGRFSFGEEPPVLGVTTFFVQFDGNIDLPDE